MTRKKVKLAFITNDSARKITYKKRKYSLLKKMDELTTLCDVKTCAILYSPYETKPVVWPDPSTARDVTSIFKRLPEMEKVKKMVSQEEFLKQRVAKAHHQLKRKQKVNREKEMTQVMYECLIGKTIDQNMNMLDLSDLGWVINKKWSEINKRIETIKKDNSTLNNNNNNFNLIITNNNINNISISNNITNHFVSSLLPLHKAVGLGVGGEVLQEQRENLEAMQMQMMMLPWSPYMDMVGPSNVLDRQHQYQHHPQQGLGSGFNGVSNGNASNSTSNNNNNNMNMMMMMGQLSDYQGNDVNQVLWSNAFFLDGDNGDMIKWFSI